MTMKLERIDGEKKMGQPVERIEIIIGDEKYTITERHGKLNIHAHSDSLTVSPCCANQIDIKGL